MLMAHLVKPDWLQGKNGSQLIEITVKAKPADLYEFCAKMKEAIKKLNKTVQKCE
jgi:hypothetical protein